MDVRITQNLYYGKQALVRVKGKSNDEVEIRRVVRQGCVLSPLLCNIYSEVIFSVALNEMSNGININGTIINNTVILADLLDGLHRLLNQMVIVVAVYGIAFDTDKTKYMVITKDNINKAVSLALERLTYVGCLINDRCDQNREIRQRITEARGVFLIMRNVLSGNTVSLTLRIRIVKRYVYSVLLYGIDAWTLTKVTSKKLEAFEMWGFRRILKISWTEHVSNNEVPRRMRIDREFINNIKIRNLTYLGHIIA